MFYRTFIYIPGMLCAPRNRVTKNSQNFPIYPLSELVSVHRRVLKTLVSGIFKYILAYTLRYVLLRYLYCPLIDREEIESYPTLCGYYNK